MRASVAADSLNEENRTVDVVWTTGERVLRGFFDTYYEELSLKPKHVRMDRLKGGAPLLNAHNGFDLRGVIGVVESARLEKDQGVATVRFARAEDDPDADAIFRKVRDGIIRNVSVGYRVHKLEKVTEEEGKIPVYRATDWEPYEISMVPIGADAGAGVRSEGAVTNPCEFVAGEQQERSMPRMKTPKTSPAAATRAEPGEGQPNGDDADEGGDGEGTQDEDGDTAGDAETPPPAPPPAPPADERAIGELAVRRERIRVAAMQRLGRALRLPEAFVARHIEGGTSMERFRKFACDHAEESGHIETGAGPNISAGEDPRDKYVRGVGDWLIMRSGHSDMVTAAAKLRGETVKIDPGEFRGMSLIDLARASLERAGVSTRGLTKQQIAEKAFVTRAGGYHSTSDFAVALEGTVSRTLLGAYALAQDTWRLFAKKGSVSDFRPHSRIRMGSFSRLEKVNEHGEFKNKPITDGLAEEISAQTYGNIVGITRQMIVNDDLGAFTSIAQGLGRAAKRSIELMVYDLLAENAGLGPTMSDGLTLFHATHGNIGGGDAIAVEFLGTDMLLMGMQTEQDGNDYLDIQPKVLLVPLNLKLKAIGMIESEFDIDVADGATPNPIRNALQVVGSPRISGTRRYMFADPNEVPTLEVVFLDGQEEPYLAQQDGWRIDGTEWKVRLDVGAGAVDYRGAVTDAGA